VTEPDYDPGVELVQAGLNTVMTRTFSKIHGLAELRVGWGYFPEPIADIVNRVRHPNNVGTVAIAGAAAAIADRAHMAAIRATNAALRTSFVEQLWEAEFLPCDSHANFVLLPLASADEANAAREFLKGRGILVRPMTAYGLDRCIRITIGTPDDMQAVGNALRGAFPSGS
jgi:histidinol-phosphate aminotransferase